MKSSNPKPDLKSARASTLKIIDRCMLLIGNLAFLFFFEICKVTLQREISVLMYHSIDSNKRYVGMSPYKFQRQVEYLRKKYTIVSLNEIMDFVEGKKGLPKKAVAITFDDGYDDNYFVAYPYLRLYDLPATIFVATDFNQKTTLADGRNVFAKMLSWNEIKEMSQNGITIGAHTLTHRDLTNMDLEEARNEILGSKEEIERQIGKRVDYFSYPFGSYDNRIVKLVRTLGFRGVFGGLGTIQQGADAFDLNRIPISGSDTFLMFSVKLTRATDWTSRIVETIKRALF